MKRNTDLDLDLTECEFEVNTTTKKYIYSYSLNSSRKGFREYKMCVILVLFLLKLS